MCLFIAQNCLLCCSRFVLHRPEAGWPASCQPPDAPLTPKLSTHAFCVPLHLLASGAPLCIYQPVLPNRLDCCLPGACRKAHASQALGDCKLHAHCKLQSHSRRTADDDMYCCTSCLALAWWPAKLRSSRSATSRAGGVTVWYLHVGHCTTLPTTCFYLLSHPLPLLHGREPAAAPTPHQS